MGVFQPRDTYQYVMPSMEFNADAFVVQRDPDCRDPQDLHALVVDHEGDRMCTAGKNNTIKVYKLSTGELQHTLVGHTYAVNALLLVGDILYSGADAKGLPLEFLKAWNITTGELVHTYQGQHTGGVYALATHGNRLFAGGDDMKIRVWDTNTNECVGCLEGHTQKVRCLHYCTEDDKLYSGGHDGQILVWDVEAGAKVSSLDGQSGFITSMCIDGDFLFSSSSDKTVVIWNRKDGQRLSIVSHDSWVSSVTTVNGLGGKVMVAGVGDGTMSVWDYTNPAQATLQYRLRAHKEFHAVSAIAVEGKKLYSAGWDGAVTNFDLEGVQARFVEATDKANKAIEAAEVEEEAPAKVEVKKADPGSIFDETDASFLLD